MSSNGNNGTSEIVKEYYGKVLKTSSDLQTGACCTTDSMEPYIRDILKVIHPEVTEKFYGCGSPLPESLEGLTVLDLGCGSGRDCYMLSKLVGENGKVIGVDMTDEQLDVAKKHLEHHASLFGYKESNVTFHKGYIEDLKNIGIEDSSIDLVVSNCVINLSPDKKKVFSEIFRVLKPGGELYFSDVFSGSRIPKDLAGDPLLLGECLGGAIYTEDYRRLMAGIGCKDFRTVSKRPVPLLDKDVEAKIGMIDFYSITVRAFNLPQLEDKCEDFGQVAYYLGTIDGHPNFFALDNHHLFTKGKPMTVCGNTASMIEDTRYAKHFKVVGDRSVHYGLFNCAPKEAGRSLEKAEDGACC